MSVGLTVFLALAFLLPRYAWSDNVATRWVVHAFDAVRSGTPALHTGTPGAGRTYAMVTVAMYDAVNGIDRAAGTSDLEPALAPTHFGECPR